MLGYVVRRVLASVPTMLLVYTLVFFIAHVTPGSPWDIGSNRPVEPTVKATLDAKYHLNEPLHTQYVEYLLGALHGDLGPSYRDRTQNVQDIIVRFLPVSLELGAAAMLLAIVLGLPLGALAALTRHPAVDGLIRMLSTLGVSMPTYVVTSILIVVLGVELGLVPTFGWRGFSRPRRSSPSSRWHLRRSPPSSAISAVRCSRSCILTISAPHTPRG